MNLENEKREESTTLLLIINLLIWVPLFIILFLLFSVVSVSAESYSYRQRVWDYSDNLINDNYSSGINGSGKAWRFYTNITRDSSIPQGQFMNIYVNYAIAYRFQNANVNTTIKNIDFILYDYNSNTYDITNSCTTTQVINRETSESSPYSYFNRFTITISCTNIPAQENINGLLIVSKPTGNILHMGTATNVTYALQINDVWLKSNNETTDTDKILINNNENFNKLMEENAQNFSNLETGDWWTSPGSPTFDNFNHYDSAHNEEMGLIDEIQELSWNGFSFDVDNTSLNLVWVWLSRLLLENLAVKAMIMTLLCLGIIKLVLNR